MNHSAFLSLKTSSVLTGNPFRLEKRSLYFPRGAATHKVSLIWVKKGNLIHS